MHVGLIDLAAQYEAHKPEIDAAVSRVLASGRYVLGDEVTALESELAAMVGRKHAIGVSSGSDALLSSLWALGVGPGDEVVTTSFSFFATVGAIVRLGATPLFADIDARTFHLDFEDVRRLITAKTKAIVVVPLFGRPLDCAPLADLNVPIVIDGAQAAGCPKLGAPAFVTTLSFFPTKNLGAVGDGGMVLTDDDAYADRVRVMRQHGSRPKYVHHLVGGNFRLDALQAAILRAGADALRPGGTLVYSTCTIVTWSPLLSRLRFLAEHPGFAADPLGASEWSLWQHGRRPMFLQTLPHRDGTDGFFVARLRRSETP